MLSTPACPKILAFMFSFLYNGRDRLRAMTIYENEEVQKNGVGQEIRREAWGKG